MTLTLDPAIHTTTSEVRVRFCETDLMGIVHHATYLVYFETGRVEWLRRRGVAYADFQARNVHLPVVDLQIRYRASSRFDECLTVATTLAKLARVSLDFTYRIRRGATLIAEGSTRLACIDAQHKLIAIPDDLCAMLCAGELPPSQATTT